MTIHTEEKPLACEKCDGLLGGLLQGWKLSLQIRPQITGMELVVLHIYSSTKSIHMCTEYSQYIFISENVIFKSDVKSD